MCFPEVNEKKIRRIPVDATQMERFEGFGECSANTIRGHCSNAEKGSHTLRHIRNLVGNQITSKQNRQR